MIKEIILIFWTKKNLFSFLTSIILVCSFIIIGMLLPVISYSGNPFDSLSIIKGKSFLSLLIYIFLNNIRVVLGIMLGAFTYGIITIILLLINGLMFGYLVFKVVFVYMSIFNIFYLYILFEILAYICASSIGLKGIFLSYKKFKEIFDMNLEIKGEKEKISKEEKTEKETKQLIKKEK